MPNFITEKIGPLPAWGWVIAGGAAMFFFFRKSSQPGSQGIQYVLSYVPQSGAGGGTTAGGGSSSPPPPVGTPTPAPNPPQLTTQQILSYFQWANPNSDQSIWAGVQQSLSQLSPTQLQTLSNSITQSAYYPAYTQGQSVFTVAPWLPNYKVPSGANNPGDLSQASTPPASLTPAAAGSS